MDLPAPATYKDAKNGGKILLTSDGHEFSKNKDDGKKIHYVCRHKIRHGCKVTAAVSKETDQIVRVTGDHTHDTDILNKIAKTMEDDAVKAAATVPTVPPRTVMANLVAHLQEEHPMAVGYLSKSKTLSRKIQRERNKLTGCGPIPRVWDEMVVPDILRVTASNEEFLIVENQVAENVPAKIIGFCSPSARVVLNDSEEWYGDGTFDIAKSTMFVQVFILIAKSLTGVTVPCSYFLLPNKEYVSYKFMFQSIKNLGVSPPRVFYCDFEAGIIKAMGEVFPETNIVCCDAHFKRAVRKHIQSSHLQTAYNSNVAFQTFVRYLWGLSLVPVDNVLSVWENYIVPNIPDDADVQWGAAEDDINDFIDYFEKTWIGGKNIRTNARRNPKFRHHLWNKFEAVCHGNSTTTNSSEGYNHALQMSLPNHANIWVVIKQFKSEDALMAVKLRDAAIGIDVDAGRKKVKEREQRRKDLFKLVSNFNNIPIEEYMQYLV